MKLIWGSDSYLRFWSIVEFAPVSPPSIIDNGVRKYCFQYTPDVVQDMGEFSLFGEALPLSHTTSVGLGT